MICHIFGFLCTGRGKMDSWSARRLPNNGKHLLFISGARVQSKRALGKGAPTGLLKKKNQAFLQAQVPHDG
jgi:hypothetical protein